MIMKLHGSITLYHLKYMTLNPFVTRRKYTLDNIVCLFFRSSLVSMYVSMMMRARIWCFVDFFRLKWCGVKTVIDTLKIRSMEFKKSIFLFCFYCNHILFTPQPSGLEGYCRHGPGGRAGGRAGGRTGGRAVGRAAARLAEPISL